MERLVKSPPVAPPNMHTYTQPTPASRDLSRISCERTFLKVKTPPPVNGINRANSRVPLTLRQMKKIPQIQALQPEKVPEFGIFFDSPNFSLD
jgi:hypothetical protein